MDASYCLQNEPSRRRTRRRRRRRRRRAEKLAAVQTPAVPTGSKSGSRCLRVPSPPLLPCPRLPNRIHGDVYKRKLYLSSSSAGSQNGDSKSTTSLGLSSVRTVGLAAPDTARTSSSAGRCNRSVREATGGTRFSSSPLPKSLSSVLSSRISPSLARLRSNHHIPPRP